MLAARREVAAADHAESALWQHLRLAYGPARKQRWGCAGSEIASR